MSDIRQIILNFLFVFDKANGELRIGQAFVKPLITREYKEEFGEVSSLESSKSTTYLT